MSLNNEQTQRGTAAMLEMLSYMQMLHNCGNYRQALETTDMDLLDLAKAGAAIGEMALSLGAGDAEFEHRVSQLQKTALRIAARGADDD